MNVKRILCPVDFSPCSNTAFQHAVDIAATNKASILLVHVSPSPPMFASGYDGCGPLPPYDPEPDPRLEKMKDFRVKIDYAHLVGLEGEAIVRHAELTKCDAIVMGTHGYRGLRKFVMGSVADFVMRHAKCPVIVVKDHHAEEKDTGSSQQEANANS